jgi:hypothetical protein
MKRGWRTEAGRLAGAVWNREGSGRLAIGLLAAVRPVGRKGGGAVRISHAADGPQLRRDRTLSRSGS